MNSLWRAERLRPATPARDVVTGLALAAVATIVSHAVARKAAGAR